MLPFKYFINNLLPSDVLVKSNPWKQMWPDHLKLNNYNLLHLITQGGLFLNNLGKIQLNFLKTQYVIDILKYHIT